MKKRVVLLCVVMAVLSLAACDKLKGSETTGKKEDLSTTETPYLEADAPQGDISSSEVETFAIALQDLIAMKDLTNFADVVNYPINVTYPDAVAANNNELINLGVSDVLNDAFATDVFSADSSAIEQDGSTYKLGSDERYVKFVWSENDSKYLVTEIVNPK